MFPSVVHQNVESINLTDISEDSLSSLKYTPDPLIDLENYPLEFILEVSSSHQPFLKFLSLLCPLKPITSFYKISWLF
jgi:hypothetical protein